MKRESALRLASAGLLGGVFVAWAVARCHAVPDVDRRLYPPGAAPQAQASHPFLFNNTSDRPADVALWSPESAGKPAYGPVRVPPRTSCFIPAPAGVLTRIPDNWGVQVGLTVKPLYACTTPVFPGGYWFSDPPQFMAASAARAADPGDTGCEPVRGRGSGPDPLASAISAMRPPPPRPGPDSAMILTWVVLPLFALAGSVGLAVHRGLQAQAAAREATPPHVDEVLCRGELRSRLGHRFRLLEKLGEGGMGVVYRAARLDDGSDTEYAIKTMAIPADDPRLLTRFEREVSICSNLVHPSIVHIFDYGSVARPEAGGGTREVAFAVMEFVHGQELRSLLTHQGRLGVEQTVRILTHTLQGLAFAHQQGVIHRDLKPENLMILGDDAVKILDFGLARVVHQMGATRTHHVMGSPLYMSPEHFNAKQACAASDIYSLGMITYEMLTGHGPFGPNPSGDVWNVLGRLLTESPILVTEFRPDVPSPLAWVLDKMLAHDLSERYPDAPSVLADLELALG